MRTIELPSDQFDCEGFVDSLLTFNREVFGPPVEKGIDDSCRVFVATIDEEGEAHWFSDGEHGDKDPKQLLAEGETLFLPFHQTDDEGERILCADGQAIPVPDEEDEDGNPNPDWDEEYEEIAGMFGSAYGFLLMAKDGTTRIESVWFYGGGCTCPSGVRREQDCGMLDEAMEAFVRGFIRE